LNGEPEISAKENKSGNVARSSKLFFMTEI